MKKIFSVFRLDLKSLTKNLIVFVVVIGITILPALYAWFNIAANWDPYTNTGDLSFAVCSKDKGYKYKSLSLNAGDSIIDNLKENDKMGWDFVDEDEAVDGVKNGKYYAAIIIPENFSEDLLSITTGDFTQAKLKYYVDEKKNAIAPKITDKGIEALEQSIGSTYVSSLTEKIAAVMNLGESEYKDSKEKLADKIKTSLKNTKADIDTFNSSVDLLISTLDSIDDLIKANKEMGPGIQDAIAKAGVFTTDVADTITSTKGIASQISSSIDGLIASGSAYVDDISNQLDDVFGTLSEDTAAVSNKLEKLKAPNQKIISVNNKIIGILENIQTTMGIDCSKVIDALKKSNDKQNAIIDKIDSICDTITKTGKLPSYAKSELDALVSEANTELVSAESEFSAIKQKIDTKVSDSFSSLDDVTDFLQSLSTGTTQLDKVFDSGLDTIANLKKVLEDLKSVLSSVKDKIDTLIEKVDDVESSNLIENIITPIIENPEALGGFVSSPVAYDTTRVYPIENYGTAMTPFYSSLALWVGGVVLVAVLNVDLTAKDRKRLGKANPVQLFFGRYVMFFIISQIQAIIIALGDLFFLKIQCENPLMFILTCMISSIVYSLIIYSLTITFSVIGKALAVIILILQVAGSGGTFPIELLPAPFKALAPFLPFRYGINALRETVAGMDWQAYLKDICLLLLFIIPALILGLLLRKPCIKIIAFFNKKVEESDLVI